jgi:hypothetical protein
MNIVPFIGIYLRITILASVAASKRLMSHCCRFLASCLNPVNLINLKPETVDKLVNAYQRDLPRKVEFVDEVERWNIRWVLADDKHIID